MKVSVNDYFKKNGLRLLFFVLFTACVSFFAPLKSFQLKWLIDSKSKEEAFGYLGLVFAITHDVSGAFMQGFDKIYHVRSGVVTAE